MKIELPSIDSEDRPAMELMMPYSPFECHLSCSDAIALLRTPAPVSTPLLPTVVSQSQRARRAVNGDVIAAVVPLYATSICSETCTYCNFRQANRGRRLVRQRLSVSELTQEAEFLIREKGYRAVELVYAGDPGISTDDMANHVRLVRTMLEQSGGGIVGFNALPLKEDDYRVLVDAGLDFVVLWQETYARELHDYYHAGSPVKSDFDFRYTACDRMLRAGITHIGMGVLSGLAPWREDWAKLIEHEECLYHDFGIRPAILGLPRLKPSVGAAVKKTPYIPTDDEFAFALAVHTLYAPETVPWVSTREPWDLCVRLAGGGSLFTLDCCTTPGGYTQPTVSYQFPTYSFPIETFAPMLRDRGLRLVTDWSFGDSGGIRERSCAVRDCKRADQ